MSVSKLIAVSNSFNKKLKSFATINLNDLGIFPVWNDPFIKFFSFNKEDLKLNSADVAKNFEYVLQNMIVSLDRNFVNNDSEKIPENIKNEAKKLSGRIRELSTEKYAYLGNDGIYEKLWPSVDGFLALANNFLSGGDSAVSKVNVGAAKSSSIFGYSPMQIQVMLEVARRTIGGWDQIVVDGIIGNKTKEAINGFKVKSGIGKGSVLDEPTVVQLAQYVYAQTPNTMLKKIITQGMFNPSNLDSYKLLAKKLNEDSSFLTSSIKTNQQPSTQKPSVQKPSPSEMTSFKSNVPVTPADLGELKKTQSSNINYNLETLAIAKTWQEPFHEFLNSKSLNENGSIVITANDEQDFYSKLINMVDGAETLSEDTTAPQAIRAEANKIVNASFDLLKSKAAPVQIYKTLSPLVNKLFSI